MEVNYQNYREKLGNAIQAKREEKGLSRDALAKKIEGVCSKTIDRIEKASYPRDIGLHTLEKVCCELRFSVKLTLGVQDD
ncbi:helix-turn-helix transcriptional regulator [Candidatus Pacearchaeota archaeon]|nr:helix-turn-helix transcriptional regulator [Candidatus Pacearchaeota archaeon]